MEYIINEPEILSGLVKINKQLYFIKIPKGFSSLNFKKQDILGVLNKILEIIFTYSSNCNYIIHFFKKEAIENINHRERIPVFNIYKDFLNYLGTNELYENILSKLILVELFKSIDNYSLKRECHHFYQ